MKRESIRNLMMIFVVTIFITGCSAGSNGAEKESIKDTGTGTDITKLLETAEAESENTEETESSEKQNQEENEASVWEGIYEVGEEEAVANISAGDVDVDLTVLSSTMVYAEVFNMVTQPEDYVGKSIRIQGLYYPSYYDETDKYYHYVVITDATACCQSGLEFIWIGNENGYPEDYPVDGTEVELTGVYGSYEELGQVYYYIATEEIVIK